MNIDHTYDVVIIGGGLAGLSLAIQLASKQHRILVLEKDDFPRHKVCGEYVSMESKPFLGRLGISIDDLDLPIINKLQVTDALGNEVNAVLETGGFGISRYKLDDLLATLARTQHVTLLTNTKADEVIWAGDTFEVRAKGSVYRAKLVCGAWGKRSNLDIKLQRPFIQEKQKALNNYVGVKYHVRYDWPKGLIGLHNFENGYCGVSRIEEDKCCLCYLTTAANLQRCSNDIKRAERDILMKNPTLKTIFNEATFLYETALAISQISFQKKEQVRGHVLLLGDAAGVITPLCGNGMSMAFRSAHIAFGLIDGFLNAKITRSDLEGAYALSWKNAFSDRLFMGRTVQRNFGKNWTTALFLKSMNLLPFVRNGIIKATSGPVF